MKKAFIDLPNPKAILERHICQFYPILSENEIMIPDGHSLQRFINRPAGKMKRSDFVNKFLFSKRQELKKVNSNFRNHKSKLNKKIKKSNISLRFKNALEIKDFLCPDDNINYFGLNFNKKIINKSKANQ